MELIKLVENLTQRKRENELLASIAELSDRETAEVAANIYTSEKHLYSFDDYLFQLEKMQIVLASGVSSEIALKLVNS